MAKTYNPKRVIVTYRGALITGFADGSFVSVERATDSFSTQAGADGEVARVASADKSGTVRITLLQTSASNDFLSASLREDELTNQGGGPLMIKDANGRTLVVAADAWIQRAPNIEFAKEGTAREWTFGCAKIEESVGGNF